MRRPTIIEDKDFVIFFFLANSISIFTNIQYSRHFLSSSPSMPKFSFSHTNPSHILLGKKERKTHTHTIKSIHRKTSKKYSF